jgi:hypothetical protein
MPPHLRRDLAKERRWRGITATSSAANISIQQPSTSYSWSTSDGATEYLSFGPTNNGNVEIEVEGSITAGDTLTITANNAALSGGEGSASYTVQTGDSFISVATGLAAALNANSSLSALSIFAANSSPAVLKWSQAFTANAPISSYTPIEMSSVDGGSNTAGIDYTMYVQGANSFPSYDFNGNMTSDGTNTYTWDDCHSSLRSSFKKCCVPFPGTPVGRIGFTPSGPSQ